MKKDKVVFSEDIPQNTKKTIKRLIKALKVQNKKLIIVGILTIFSSIFYTIIPLMIGLAINNLVSAISNFDKSTNILEVVVQALTKPILVLILISIISSILSYIQQYIISSVGENLTLSLREDISKKINKLPLKHFDSHKKGDRKSVV